MIDQELDLTNKNIFIMNTLSFDKLLLKTAFCCMASDGHMDDREIVQIQQLCKELPLFEGINLHQEINELVEAINDNSTDFIKHYFNTLSVTSLSESEELTLIDFAIKVINADNKVEYSEIKFFKNIRCRLNVSDDKILEQHPGIEIFLDEDLKTDSYLDKLMINYLETVSLPKFDLIKKLEL